MKIRRQASAAACFAASLFACAVQATEVTRIDITNKTATASAAAAPHKLLLWKVTRPNGKGVVYILGSMHLVPPGFYPLPETIEKAFRDSQELVLEMDETKQDPAQMQQLTFERGLYPEGDSIEKHLTKETNEALKKYLAKTPMPPGYSRMKPWLLSMSVQLAELQQRGFDPKQGIDRHFLEEAKEAGKPVDELESAQFQFNLLSGFNDDLQDKLLMSSLLDAGNTDRDTHDMVEAWKNGDAAQMGTVVTRDESEHPELKPVMEELVYKRNATMEKKIEEFLNSDKSYFVVVGAGHLVGARGVVEMLKNKGYTVEQLSGA